MGRPRTDGKVTEAVPLVVDHDHDTGAVRGLLCQRCNALLSSADLAWLRVAVEYLEAPSAQGGLTTAAANGSAA